MASKMKNIGVDIGGTFIKCAVADETGRIEAQSKTPTPKDGSKVPEEAVRLAKRVIESVSLTFDDIHSFGIGAPTICDSARGVCTRAANIENFENVFICDYVTRETGVRAYLDNDANCAALGEYMVSGERCASFVFVTLGTGVGGGIILNGRLFRGVNGGAGEIGHMTFVHGGEKCGCGNQGCWECYASVSALVRQTKAAGFEGEVTGRTVFERSVLGDERAKKALDRWLGYVAEGICGLVNIFQPEILVIGGGISREGDKILKPIKKFVSERCITAGLGGLPETKIEISRLFNDAGVIGASFLHTQN